MADVVIFGASMTAQVARVFLDQHTDHRIVGFTVDAAYATSDRFDGLPLVPWERIQESFPPSQVHLLGPISYRRLNEFRRDRYLEGKARGYGFVSFVHPSCTVYTEDIGEHCFISARTIIEPYAKIGNNVVLWGDSYVAHHAVVGDHCFFSGRAGIAGGTKLGERCFLGGQTIVAEGLTIGEGCLLGFGAVVTKNLPAGSIVRRAAKDEITSVPAARARRLL